MADDQKKVNEPADPIIATSFSVVGDENGAVFLFTRPVYMQEGDQIKKADVRSAALAVPWGLIEKMREVCAQIIEGREKALADVMAQKKPADKPVVN